MKKFILLLVLIGCAIASSIVFAQYTPQSSPGFTGGGTLWGRTAAQVNQYFQNKVDAQQGTAYELNLSKSYVVDTLSFLGTSGNVLTTLPGSNVNLGGSLSVAGNTNSTGPITAPNVLNNQVVLSSSTTLTASQAGSYVFWNGSTAGTITLPNSQSFATTGGDIFYIQNNGTANVSIATVSTDHNALPGGNNALGGSITLASGKSVIAVASPATPGWQSLNLNLVPSLQSVGPISAGGLITGSNIANPSVITLGTNPPVSGTAYQWTGPGILQLSCPILMNPTSTAAAIAALDIGPTNPPSTQIDYQARPAGAAVAGETISLHADVPNGWYYEISVTNATIDACVAVAH